MISNYAFKIIVIININKYTIHRHLELITQEYEDMVFMVITLLEEYEKWGLKINLEKNFLVELWSRNQNLIFEDQEGCIRGCEEFKYLELKIDKEDRQENDIKNRINKGRAVTAMLNSALWNREITRKNKLLNS